MDNRRALVELQEEARAKRLASRTMKSIMIQIDEDDAKGLGLSKEALEEGIERHNLSSSPSLRNHADTITNIKLEGDFGFHWPLLTLPPKPKRSFSKRKLDLQAAPPDLELRKSSALLLAFHGFGLPFPTEDNLTLGWFITHFCGVFDSPFVRKEDEEGNVATERAMKHILNLLNENLILKCECPKAGCPLFNVRMFAFAPCIERILRKVLLSPNVKLRSLAMKIGIRLYAISSSSLVCTRYESCILGVHRAGEPPFHLLDYAAGRDPNDMTESYDEQKSSVMSKEDSEAIFHMFQNLIIGHTPITEPSPIRDLYSLAAVFHSAIVRHFVHALHFFEDSVKHSATKSLYSMILSRSNEPPVVSSLYCTRDWWSVLIAFFASTLQAIPPPLPSRHRRESRFHRDAREYKRTHSHFSNRSRSNSPASRLGSELHHSARVNLSVSEPIESKSAPTTPKDEASKVSRPSTDNWKTNKALLASTGHMSRPRSVTEQTKDPLSASAEYAMKIIVTTVGWSLHTRKSREFSALWLHVLTCIALTCEADKLRDAVLRDLFSGIFEYIKEHCIYTLQSQPEGEIWNSFGIFLGHFIQFVLFEAEVKDKSWMSLDLKGEVVLWTNDNTDSGKLNRRRTSAFDQYLDGPLVLKCCHILKRLGLSGEYDPSLYGATSRNMDKHKFKYFHRICKLLLGIMEYMRIQDKLGGGSTREVQNNIKAIVDSKVNEKTWKFLKEIQVVEPYDTVLHDYMKRLDPAPVMMHFRLTSKYLFFSKDIKDTYNKSLLNSRGRRHSYDASTTPAVHIMPMSRMSLSKSPSQYQKSRYDVEVKGEGGEILKFATRGIMVLDEIQRVEIVNKIDSKALGKIENAFIIAGRDETFTVEAPDDKTMKKWVHFLALAIESARMRTAPDGRKGLCSSVWDGLHVDAGKGKFYELKDIRSKHIEDKSVALSLVDRATVKKIEYKETRKTSPNRRRSLKEAPILRRINSVVHCRVCGHKFGNFSIMSKKCHCSICGGVFHAGCTRKEKQHCESLHSILQIAATDSLKKKHTSSGKPACLDCFWEKRKIRLKENQVAMEMRESKMSLQERLAYISDDILIAPSKLLRLLECKIQDIFWIGSVISQEGSHKKNRIIALLAHAIYVLDKEMHKIKYEIPLASVKELAYQQPEFNDEEDTPIEEIRMGVLMLKCDKSAPLEELTFKSRVICEIGQALDSLLPLPEGIDVLQC
ncbi:hypothetical protein AAMO2058_001317600 [Amorphochlora amoebiformis]